MVGSRLAQSPRDVLPGGQGRLQARERVPPSVEAPQVCPARHRWSVWGFI